MQIQEISFSLFYPFRLCFSPLDLLSGTHVHFYRIHWLSSTWTAKLSLPPIGSWWINHGFLIPHETKFWKDCLNNQVLVIKHGFHMFFITFQSFIISMLKWLFQYVPFLTNLGILTLIQIKISMFCKMCAQSGFCWQITSVNSCSNESSLKI